MSSLKTQVSKLISLASDLKSEDIKSYDLTGKSVLTDLVIIISVNNTVHSRAVLNELTRYFKKDLDDHDFFSPLKLSGTPESGWVILDANSVVVHIVFTELREHYQLDNLFESMA